MATCLAPILAAPTPAGTPQTYAEFAAALRRQMAPGSPREELAVERFTRASWNALRLQEVETNLLADLSLAADPATIATLDSLSRQVARHERTMRDALKDFEANKTERLDAYEEHLRAQSRQQEDAGAATANPPALAGLAGSRNPVRPTEICEDTVARSRLQPAATAASR